MNSKVDELLATTKRIRATLANGQPPKQVPESTVWQEVQGREWMLTVSDFTEETMQQINSEEGIDHVEVIDLGLEDLFKDYVRGRKVIS